MGKKLWEYVSRTFQKSKATDKNYKTMLDVCEANTAKIIT